MGDGPKPVNNPIITTLKISAVATILALALIFQEQIRWIGMMFLYWLYS